MPVAATGQPTTQEPRVCLRLPSTPEPVPKGADLFDEAGAAERIEYGGAEGGRGLGGYTQPGSISGTPPQSPAASTSFLFHPLHSHQMAVEPPRTRSRSRSGYYQQYSSGNGNGITSTGLMGSNHHPNQQQHLHFQQQQQQQHGAGCAPLGAPGGHTENQPGINASAGIQRFSSVPEAHPIPAPGASGGSYHCLPDIIYGEERDKSEESPRPKRQRLSSNYVLEQLTSSALPPSTPSPPIRPWESSPPSRRQPPSLAHYDQERCQTPVRLRRSTPVRRQRCRLSRPSHHLHPSPQGQALPSPPELQDGNYRHNHNPSAQQAYPTQTPSAYSQPSTTGSGGSGLEEPRAFHPPTLSSQILHPAARHHHHHHQQQHHGAQRQQGSVVMDLHDQQANIPVSYTVTHVPPQGLTTPLCSGQHLPPTCSSQQQVPSCNVVISAGQHYHPVPQACSVQHFPVPYGFPSLLSSDQQFLLSHPPHLSPHPPHLPVPGQFLHFQSQQPQTLLQRLENEVDLLGEQLSVGGGYNYAHHHHHHHHQGPSTLPSSTPLHFLSHHDPPSQELFTISFPNFIPRLFISQRYRSQQTVPPSAYHPNFMPYFLSIVPVPPNVAPTINVELEVENGEVENYEALLNLAERLGEAKPRGLTKADIEHIPSYKFNSNNHHSEQTMCVVCMCDFESRQLLRVLPCSHEFHAKCVDKWLKANRTCPICRAEVQRD
ncbi:E3 ubiquitin-protein ligase RNF38-like isoform X1 [Takifugu rubripes]|uniref:Ring finger protein 38 n=1 Tax=Takifugu rubripes TaxID=31033 RepID=A0A674MJQ3_TAKRU|nr:E3 ubiquitin-protein ligase RNF38-like isoform X1 [Takifugu rubripes]XP_029706791.1 E3 ubiquitin-protein ligase RNF38-like isoform X1 [Takifugu rubripes]